MRHLLTISAAILIVLTACHKRSTIPSSAILGPACDVYRARPTAIGYIGSSNDTNWTSYIYNSKGQMTMDGFIQYIYNNDTLWYDYVDENYAVRVYRYYRGDGIVYRVRTFSINRTAPYDTIKIFDYSYTYDNLNEMTSAVVHRMQDGIPGIVTTDSTLYTWRDGNMVHSVNYVDNTVTDFEYIPNTNGWTLKGEPYRQAKWIYTGNPVLSKNLVSRSIRNGKDTIFYDPHLNTYGTVNYINLTYHNSGSPPGYSTIVFKYECY